MEIDIVKCNFMLMKTLKWNIQLHCNPFHFDTSTESQQRFPKCLKFPLF